MRATTTALLLAPLTAARSPFDLDGVEAKITAFADHTIAGSDSGSLSGCALACGFLSRALPEQVAYPKSAAYELQEAHYFSQQQAFTRPACRISPKSADDVSLAVLTARVTQCKFAVKSGGHASFAGASNIEGGLTLDLERLNEVTVSDDKSQTTVGAGNLWYDVYTKLSPQNLTVIGGRVAAIGVGGLTLGGGVSFFSSRHGWACDNVDSYEVVFADGSIHDVSRDSPYADVYWALRGGGNNFGIVTRFKLVTYPQEELWASQLMYPFDEKTVTSLNDAFYQLAGDSSSDPDASVILVYAYVQQLDTFVAVADVQFARPEPYPAALRGFTDVPGAIVARAGVIDLPALTVEFNNSNPGGLRQSVHTLTVGNSATLLGELAGIYKEEITKIKDVQGLVPTIIYQPLSAVMLSHGSKNGGNPLGLAGQGPLTLVEIDMTWSDVADDERINAAVDAIMARSLEAAKKNGLLNKYIYQNYAAPEQLVFPNYGQENWDRLKAISDKHDPHKVWQKLQPGFFHVG